MVNLFLLEAVRCCTHVIRGGPCVVVEGRITFVDDQQRAPDQSDFEVREESGEGGKGREEVAERAEEGWCRCWGEAGKGVREGRGWEETARGAFAADVSLLGVVPCLHAARRYVSSGKGDPPAPPRTWYPVIAAPVRATLRSRALRSIFSRFSAVTLGSAAS